MDIAKLNISGIEIENLVSHLRDKLPVPDYLTASSDMVIIAIEEYYFRTGSTQMNIVTLKQADHSIDIDIIGSAGGTGFFNINWGSERSFIKKVKKIVKKLEMDLGIQIEERLK